MNKYTRTETERKELQVTVKYKMITEFNYPALSILTFPQTSALDFMEFAGTSMLITLTKCAH